MFVIRSRISVPEFGLVIRSRISWPEFRLVIRSRISIPEFELVIRITAPEFGFVIPLVAPPAVVLSVLQFAIQSEDALKARQRPDALEFSRLPRHFRRGRF